jgi:hypothetical protein
VLNHISNVLFRVNGTARNEGVIEHGPSCGIVLFLIKQLEGFFDEALALSLINFFIDFSNNIVKAILIGGQ